EWDAATNKLTWDDGQYRICGVDPENFVVTPANVKALIAPEDYDDLLAASTSALRGGKPFQSEFRVRRPDGEIRWCLGTLIATVDSGGGGVRGSGGTVATSATQRRPRTEQVRARGGEQPATKNVTRG